MQKIKNNFYVIIASFVHLACLLLHSGGEMDYLLLSVTILARYVTNYTINFRKDLSLLVLLTYIEVAFFGYYLLFYLIFAKTLPLWPLQVGVLLIILYGIGNYVMKNCIKPEYNQLTTDTFDSKKTFTLLLFFIFFSFSLSYISSILEITKMGVPHPKLPYKIEPFLNLLRLVVFPIVYVIFVDLFFEKKRHLCFSIGAYLGWAVFESYIRGSRGMIIHSFVPIAFIFYKRNDFKKVFLSGCLISLLIVPLFIGGNYLRKLYVSNLSKNKTSYELDLKESAWDTFSRIFKDPQLFLDFEPYVKNNLFSNNISTLRQHGGGNKFYTHVIKGHPTNKVHAEGLTAFTDGFLTFGVFGTVLTFIILYLFSSFNDFGKIPFLKTSLGLNGIGSFALLNALVWGDGFFDFYLTRSIFTISVFPLTIFGISLILNFYLKRNKGIQSFTE